MINKETEVFDAVEKVLRNSFENIYIIPKSISTKPAIFPAVSIVLENNTPNTKYSTFNKIENVASSEYYIEIYSNDISNKEEICRTISVLIDDVFSDMRYVRKLNQAMQNADDTIARRIMRYAKNNEI